MQYSHTQIGKLMIVVFIFTALLFAGIFIAGREEFTIFTVALMIFILLILTSFITLTVTIDQEYLRIKFGYGIFCKKFKLTDIMSVKPVKHKWYYGWGVRYWVLTKTWIFNVSGFDQIEIEMKNGNKYRIGTDEVDNLIQAINQIKI